SSSTSGTYRTSGARRRSPKWPRWGGSLFISRSRRRGSASSPASWGSFIAHGSSSKRPMGSAKSSASTAPSSSRMSRQSSVTLALSAISWQTLSGEGFMGDSRMKTLEELTMLEQFSLEDLLDRRALPEMLSSFQELTGVPARIYSLNSGLLAGP